jgi:histidine triad (HIT) family protein
MSDCLFCKIAKGEIPADIVKNDQEFVAFRDVNPQAPTHLLAIPRAHVRSLNELHDDHAVGRLMMFARDAAKAEGLADDGFRLVINTNEHGGQTVWHLHVHILGGRAMGWPPG